MASGGEGGGVLCCQDNLKSLVVREAELLVLEVLDRGS